MTRSPSARRQRRPRSSGGDAPRTRDRERSRLAILEAATAEFGEKGPQGTRMEAIAARVGCDKRLLSFYFRNKKGLYRAVIEYQLAQLSDLDREIPPSTDPAAELEQLIDGYFSFLLEHPWYVRLIIQQELVDAPISRAAGLEVRTRLFSRISDLIERGQADGRFRSDLSASRVATIIVGACFHTFTLRGTLSPLVEGGLDSAEGIERQRGEILRFALSALEARKPTRGTASP
jgi:AcrR family transcriptional regulator